MIRVLKQNKMILYVNVLKIKEYYVKAVKQYRPRVAYRVSNFI